MHNEEHKHFAQGTIQGLPSDATELDVHRLLFIKDLLAAKPVGSRPRRTSNPKPGDTGTIYQLGRLYFQHVRISGILVDVVALQCPSTTKGQGTSPVPSSYFIDDGTGMVEFRLAGRLQQGHRVQRLVKGVQVDVLGQLIEEPQQGTQRLSRWINSSGFNISQDVTLECLRPLEIILLYRDHYFSRPPLSECPPPLSEAVSIPSKRPGEEDDEPFEYATQPNVFAVPPENNVDSVANLNTNNESQDEFVGFDADQDLEDLLGAVGAIEESVFAKSSDLQSEIEDFLRASSGETLIAIAAHFPDQSSQNIDTALQELAGSGRVYMIDDSYFAI